jgi:hypothetical protein
LPIYRRRRIFTLGRQKVKFLSIRKAKDFYREIPFYREYVTQLAAMSRIKFSKKVKI